jgi:competence protein ComEC
MPIIHYLNVRQGDCTIIKHGSGRLTVIDVNNARQLTDSEKTSQRILREVVAKGNFNQKDYPENPIFYMRERGLDSVFRFILTHPDMDHMDGISDFFAEFSPSNLWDTDNTCDKDADDWDSGPYRREDWEYYASLRNSTANPKRLLYCSGQQPCDFWKDDGLSVLAPTPELVRAGNDCGEWNDASYVLLYRTKSGRKAIFAGDSHDDTWEHILATHANEIGQVDLLAAPHHGRHSGRDFGFLDVVKPKLTLFGNASSEHLAYDPWNSRGLPIITNNEGGSIIVDFDNASAPVYCTNEKFARSELGDKTFFDCTHKAWLCGLVT